MEASLSHSKSHKGLENWEAGDILLLFKILLPFFLASELESYSPVLIFSLQTEDKQNLAKWQLGQWLSLGFVRKDGIFFLHAWLSKCAEVFLWFAIAHILLLYWSTLGVGVHFFLLLQSRCWGNTTNGRKGGQISPSKHLQTLRDLSRLILSFLCLHRSICCKPPWTCGYLGGGVK